MRILDVGRLMRQGPAGRIDTREPYNPSEDAFAFSFGWCATWKDHVLDPLSSLPRGELKIIGILLAAGSGSRFGGGKLLAPLADGVLVGVQSLRTLRAGIADVVVVTRPEDDALRTALRDEGARIEICPRAAEGMGASLAYGIRASFDADAWVVALGDMPRIQAATIRAVAAALEDGAVIAAPTYRGERGHPVGFAGVLREALARLSGDAGAREILRAERDRVTLIDCSDEGILADVDTPADLERIRHDGG